MDPPKVMRPPAVLPDTFKGVLLPLGLRGLTVIVEVDAIIMALQNKFVELF